MGHLTKAEWASHVWNVLPEEILSRLDQPKEEVCSLSSPAMRHRQVDSPRFAGRDGRRQPQAKPKRMLVNWYSCTAEAPEEVADSDRVMVLDLHPTDSRGPFLAAALAF